MHQRKQAFETCAHAPPQALLDMGEPYASGVELVSYHTVSKGTSGECGLRGG